MPSEPVGHTVLLENHPKVEVATRVDSQPDTRLDTGSVERVLDALEPVDHTTSFATEPTEQLPMLRAEPPAPGRRRAVKQATGRGPLFKGFLSAPVLMGVAALAVSIGGVVTVDDAKPAAGTTSAAATTHAASALGGTSGTGTVTARKPAVTRGGGRQATTASTSTATGQVQAQAAAAATAEERDQALSKINTRGDARSKVIAQNLWIYPLEPVILTARFGQCSVLWSHCHTGLDFNGETGDQIHAIADGVVISAQYDGSYGNKTVVQLSDGTELWYCHQSAFMVSPGDEIKQGQIIGLVGATGNVTGSHLHVEVHPGGGDPVDPYPAMQQHGLFLGDEAQPG